MGKKSRMKKQKRQAQQTEPNQQGDAVVEPDTKAEGLEAFLLWVIRLGTAAALFTPLVLYSRTYFPFVGPKGLYLMFFSQIVFFAWLFLALHYKKYRPNINKVLIVFTVFLIVLILASLFGVDFSRSFWSKYERMTGLLVWLHLFGLFLAMSSSLKKISDWSKIFAVSIAISIFLSVVSILSEVGIAVYRRGGSSLGNTSFLGTYLLFNVFFAVYLFFTKENKWFKAMAFTVAAIGFVCIYLAGSVDIFSSTIGGLALIGLLYLSFKPKEETARCFKGLILIAAGLGFLGIYFAGARAATIGTSGGLALVGLLYFSFISKRKSIKITSRAILAVSSLMVLISIVLLFIPGTFVSDKFVEMTTASRAVNWSMAWKGFFERPMFGWGPENYTVLFPKFFNPCLFVPSKCGGEIWFDRTHNVVLDKLATTGIFGLLAYIGLFVVMGYVLFKKYYRDKTINFWMFAVFLSLLVGYFVQNLTVFDMPATLMLFVLVLSFVAFLAGKKQNAIVHHGSDKKPVRPWVAVVLGIVFLVTLFEFVIQPLKTDIFVIKAVVTQDHNERLEYYKKTFEASSMGKYQIRDFFAQHTQDIVREGLEKAPKEVLAKELDFIVEQLTKTRKESPVDYRATLKLAQIYNVYALLDISKLELAEKYGEEAMALSPTNQQSYWTLAQVKVYQKDFEKAIELAKTAIDLEPEWLPSHKIAIQILQTADRYDEAKAFAEKAVEINPDWAGEFENVLGAPVLEE